MKINEKLFCRNNFSLKIIEKYLFNINSLIVIDFGRYKIELMFVQCENSSINTTRQLQENYRTFTGLLQDSYKKVTEQLQDSLITFKRFSAIFFAFKH